MIPLKSTLPQVGQIMPPNNSPKLPLTDWEMGGVALGDPSQGNAVKPWKLTANSSTGEITLEAFDVPATVVLTRPGIVWASFAFDQNMRFLVTYKTTSTPGAILHWYNPVPAMYVDWGFGTNVRTPHLSLDEKLESGAADNDVILTYVEGEDLIVRVQRERYITAHDWGPVPIPGQGIKNFGMSNVNRLQWEFQ